MRLVTKKSFCMVRFKCTRFCIIAPIQGRKQIMRSKSLMIGKFFCWKVLLRSEPYHRSKSFRARDFLNEIVMGFSTQLC